MPPGNKCRATSQTAPEPSFFASSLHKGSSFASSRPIIESIPCGRASGLLLSHATPPNSQFP
eukprot:10304486-Prorocentrum_lima.AAC.1